MPLHPRLQNFLLAAAFLCHSPSPALRAEAAEAIVIRNGGMTQGEAVPLEWTGREGGTTSARDTEIFKEAPASLRIEAAGKKGRAFQKITGVAGRTITLAGWMKTSGEVRAQVAIQAFAEGYKQNQFQQVKYAQGESDWAAFEKEIKVPEWAAWISVLLMAEGTGKAWLDEVHVAGRPVDAGSPGTAPAAVAELTDPKPAPPADADPLHRAPEKGAPGTPAWGFYPKFPTGWQGAHKGMLERAKKGADAEVIFIGDSITQGWSGAGQAVWTERFAKFHPLNFGIGGDSTRQVLWRIAHGEMDGLKPKAAVLMIGTNNLYGDFNAGSDAEIAAGIGAVVKALREKLPATKVLLCAVLPRENDFFGKRIAKINAEIAKLDDGKTVRVLDMTAQFQDAPGKVKTALFHKDQLHLEAAGYQAWAEAMQPVLVEMLK